MKEVDDNEIRDVLAYLDECNGHFIHHPEQSVFYRAANVIRHLSSVAMADDALLDEKDEALAAVNEGRGLADEDLWAAMKKERDAAREELANEVAFNEGWQQHISDMLDAMKPFAALTKETPGRIAVERLPFANWDALTKAFDAAVFALNNTEKK